MSFRALVLEQIDDQTVSGIRELDDSRLPDGEVTVAVAFSSLNYKDGMILQGIGRLVRNFPHVPGVDLAGVVVESASSRFSPGDAVVLTGWRVGETTWGGYSELARVRADWLVPLPAALTARQAMAVGTAGFTAMIAIDALERHGLAPGRGPLLVTGASGGLGSWAVHLASRLGYEVVAETGRPETEAYLRDLGASSIVERAELAAPPGRPLLGERWHGCVDAVGGSTLAHVLTELSYGSAVAACGNAGGNDLPLNVIPFLLRGVSVLGIDSVQLPTERRPALWDRLSSAFDPAALEEITTEVDLADVPTAAEEILAGKVRGRRVVRVAASDESRSGS